jgi:hypothetical protein
MPTSTRTVRVGLIAVLAAVPLLLAACGSGSGAGSGGTTPADPPSPAVTVVRTGGFAGVNETLTVAPDGSWLYTDHRRNLTQAGTLTPAQRAQLRAAATDPALAAAFREPAGGGCADGFQYAVTVGDLSGSFDDCGGTDHAAIRAVIAAVTPATPL